MFTLTGEDFCKPGATGTVETCAAGARVTDIGAGTSPYARAGEAAGSSAGPSMPGAGEPIASAGAPAEERGAGAGGAGAGMRK